MEKKLQDYLHYYIGCKVQKDSFALDYPTIEGVHGDTVIISKYPYRTPNCDKTFIRPRIWHSISFVKPILRRLEDISNDEWLEIECETSIAPDAIGSYGVRESIMTMETRHRFHWTITNEVLIILRKRGIDVDELIKSDLAIDAATLPK